MKTTISHSLIAIAISVLSLNVTAQVASDDIATTHHLTERFPIKVIDRPSAMPTGIVQFDVTARAMGVKSLNLQASSKFGIADKWQGEVSYDGLDFKFGKDEPEKFHAHRIVNLGTKYNYLGIPHVSFSAAAKLPIHIWDKEIVQDVTFGLPTVFYNEYVAGGVLSDVLTLTLHKPGVKFDFPFWFGGQITNNFWVEINSSFGSVSMENKNDTNVWESTGFWKKLPVRLEAIYAFNHYFDLGAHFGFQDVLAGEKKVVDGMYFGLTFTARAGRLFG